MDSGAIQHPVCNPPPLYPRTGHEHTERISNADGAKVLAILVQDGDAENLVLTKGLRVQGDHQARQPRSRWNYQEVDARNEELEAASVPPRD